MVIGRGSVSRTSPPLALNSSANARAQSSGLACPHPTIPTDSISAIHSFACRGRFLIVLPESMIRFRAKNLPLKVLPVKLPARQLPVVIVTMKNRTLSQVLGIPRSSRLLNWSNSRRCRFAGHWRRSISRDRPSTTGTAAIKTVGSKLWRTASQDRGGSGTKSPTRSARRSSIWLEEPDLSPRELAVNFTDSKRSFVSEATRGRHVE